MMIEFEKLTGLEDTKYLRLWKSGVLSHVS